MKTFIVDVAEYQGPMDWPRVEANGFGAAFVKSSGSANPMKGPFYVDSMFMPNVEGLRNTSMIRGLYHFLRPEYPVSQAAFLYERWSQVGPVWAPIIDIEQAGVRSIHVQNFLWAWSSLRRSGDPRLVIYTRKNFWMDNIGLMPMPEWSILWSAHWVPVDKRNRLATGQDQYPIDRNWMYASQQAHAIDPAWWNESYGGTVPAMLQFSDHAALWDGGPWCDVSAFQGSKAQLAAALQVRA
jgi:hypothetical protein